jgi:hypothetical protein
VKRNLDAVLLFCLVAFLIGCGLYLNHRASECADAGGVLVRGAFGLECVSVKEIKL